MGRASGLSTLLVREGVRLSRRRATWYLRLGFGALVAFFCFGKVDVGHLEPTYGGTIGRQLFETWVAIQLPVAMFLAPLTVASAIQEERDAGTFDLLLLSGLTAPAVLWGQVASRLLATLAIVAAGLPILAMVVSFGGISPWEVVNSAVAVVVTSVVLGSIAGYFALFVRSGPILPTLAALAWTLAAWWMLPLLRVGVVPGDRAWATLAPPPAAFEDGPAGLLVVPAAVPVVVLCALLGVPVFRILLTDDSEEALGLHSPDVWVLERYRGWLWGGLAAAVATFPPMVVALVVLSESGADLAVEALSWVWAVLATAFGTLVYLLAGIWLHERARRWRPWRAANRAEPRIGGNPVWWRELHAPALGGAKWLVRIAGVVGLALVAAYVLLFWRESRDLGSGPIAVGVYVVGALLTPLVAALHEVEERRARTLPVLLTTGFPARRIAFGKLAALASRLAPWLAIGFVAWVWADPMVREAVHADPTSGHARPWLSGHGWLRPWIGSLWYAGLLAALAAVTLALALRVPRPRMVWGTTAAVYLGFPLVLSAPEWIGFDTEDWLRLWFPMADDAWGCALGGVPSSLVVSTAWTVAVAGVCIAWLIHEIDRFKLDLD